MIKCILQNKALVNWVAFIGILYLTAYLMPEAKASPPPQLCNTNVTSGTCSIQFNNVDVPNRYLYVWDSSWNMIWSCENNCTGSTMNVPGLSPGTYNISYYTYNAFWGEVCNFQETVTVSCSSTGSGPTTPTGPTVTGPTVDADCGPFDVYAGSDQTVCEGTTVQLGATVSGLDSCSDCCTRTVSDTNNCTYDYNYVIFLGGDSGSESYNGYNLHWEECSDGTARLTGSANSNNTSDVIHFDITVSGGTMIPPPESPKHNNCISTNANGWKYYTHTSGTINSNHHGTLSISRRGPAFQLGNGANETSTVFGASGWIDVSGGDGYFSLGDININLSDPTCSLPSNAVSYYWSNGSSNSTINVTPTSTTTYYVTATDCNGCSQMDQVTVNVGTDFNVNVGSDITVCPGEGPVEITATSSNESSCASCCTRSVSNSNNCSNGITYSIWLNHSSGARQYSTSDLVFRSCTDGTATLTGKAYGVGFIDMLDIDVTFGGHSFIPPVNSPKHNNCYDANTFGWEYYSYTTGTFTSTAHGSMDITRKGPAFQLGNGANEVSTQFGASGWIYVSGGDGYYQDGDININLGIPLCSFSSSEVAYQWSNGMMGNSISVNPTTTTSYTVSATDCTGCLTTDVITVNVNPGDFADAGADQSICPGASVELCGSGGSSYQWSNGQNTECITVSPTSNTTYAITVSDGDCTDSDSVNVTIESSITADAGPNQGICSGDSVEICATGGSDFEWSTGETSLCITVAPMMDQTYTVTVTSEGCTDTDDVLVTVTETPSVDAGQDQTICPTESIEICASGTGSITWSNGETTDCITVSPSSTTTYTATATNGICEDSDDIIIEVSNDLTADAGGDQSICPGASIELCATGGTDFEWSTGETTACITISPMMTSDYTVTITENGCSDTDMATVTVENSITADAGQDETICVGEVVELCAIGGSDFEWSTGETTACILVSPMMDTSYIVTATSNGCTDTDEVEVIVVDLPIIDAGADQTICAGSSIEICATGSSIIDWSTGETTNCITVSPTETSSYLVVGGTDPCTAEDEITITVLDLSGSVAIDGSSVLSCTNSAVQLLGTSSIAGATFAWTGPGDFSSSDQNPSVSEAGTYELMLSSGECTFAAGSVEITGESSISSGIIAPLEVCAGEGAFFELSPLVAGASYSWDFGMNASPMNSESSNGTITWDVIGVQTVTLTVTLGACTAEYTHEINVTEGVFAVAGEDRTICEGESTTLGGSPTGPSGASYNWTPNVFISDNEIANPSANPPVSTEYTVEVTKGGCVTTETVMVNVDVEQCGLDLELTKTANVSTVVTGDQVVFTIEVLNKGPQDAILVTVEDVLPSGLDYVSSSASVGSYSPTTSIWQIGDLPKDQTETLAITTEVIAISDPITNFAQVNSGIADDGVTTDGDSTVGNDTDNTADEDDEDDATIFPGIPNEIDLELTKTVDVSTVTVGDLVTYTIEVENKGPADATNVFVNDDLPAGLSFDSYTSTNGGYSQFSGIWSIGDLPFGEVETLTLRAVVDAIDGSITNFAQVQGAGPDDSDSTPGNDIDNTADEDDEDDATIFEGEPEIIDLELSKTVDVSEVSVGDLVTYTILIENKGPEDAENVFVNDDLPAGLVFDSYTSSTGGYSQFSGIWSIGNLAMGDSEMLTLRAVVSSIDGPITNFAQVQGATPDDFDSTPGNDTDNTPNEDDEDEATIYPASPTEAGLGDYVFLDNNGNGIQDAGDQPLGGVTVNLYDSSDLSTIIGSYTTMSDGYYEFTSLDPSITYVVEFVTPNGYYPTVNSGLASAGNSNDSDAGTGGFTDVIDLVAGEIDDSIDAGFVPPSTVSGCLYLDANCNGTQDMDEMDCLPGILFNLVNADTTVILDFESTEAGIFIDNIAPGDYTLVFLNGPDGTGIVYGSDEVPITILPGQNINDILVAYSPLPTGFISGTAWIDDNGDCINDMGETLLSDATITLTDAAGNIVQTVETNSFGVYQFFGLCTGVFTVTIDAYTDNLSLQNPMNGEYTISIPFPGTNTFTAIDFCFEQEDTTPPCLPLDVTECADPNASITVCPSFCLDGATISSVFSELELGTIEILDDFCFSYQPATGFSGIENLIIEACNAMGECEDAMVSFSTIGDCTPANSAPICVDDSYSISGPFSFDPSQNDSDPDAGDQITITTNTDPDHGVVTFANGSFTYTPEQGYTGSDSFTYQICDSSNECCYSTISLEVNAAPVSSSCDANILFIGEDLTSTTDDFIIDQLEAEGHAVNFVSSTTATLADANGMDLIYISATTYAGALANTFQNVAIPVVVSESYVFDDMGMTDTGFSYYGSMGNNTSIDIADPSHPIASAYSGSVIVTSDVERFTWGMPTTDADIIATLNGYPSRSTIFAYDTGDQMVGITAPAPRVGFFIYNNAADNFNADGWTLFHSAIQWALGDCSTLGGPITSPGSCGTEEFCTEPITAVSVCPDFCTLGEVYFITDVEVLVNCSIIMVDDVCLEITPLPSHTGPITLNIEACDENGMCETKTIIINVEEDCGGGSHTPLTFKTTEPSSINNFGEPNLLDVSVRSENQSREGVIFIESQFEDSNAQLFISNINGQVMRMETLPITEGITTLQLEAMNFSQGMYFVTVQSQGQKMTAKWLVH